MYQPQSKRRLDCQSRLGEAVGKERFTKDAAEIMQCAVNSMGSEDEELKDNSMIALERISSVIAPVSAHGYRRRQHHTRF